MKKFFFLLVAFGVGIGVFAQMKPPFSNAKGMQKPLTATVVKQGDNIIIGAQNGNPLVSAKSTLSSDVYGMITTYDEQSNASVCPRCYRYPDGTIASAAMWSLQGSSYSDRGTGYNYYTPGSHGTGWQAQPTHRIETGIRNGWPSYAPWNTGGECVMAHDVVSGQNLIFSTRPTRGTGTWTVNTNLSGLTAPTGEPCMAWPRMVTSSHNGGPRMNIHVIALVPQTNDAVPGVLYQGLNGAVLYNRSVDGGVNWTGWQLLPGMTSSLYVGFAGDEYNWAEPHGDTIAFVCSPSISKFGDCFIMKSTDNGTTWTKTIVWHGPYNLWPGTTLTDTFMTPDGSCAAAIDKNGKVHVAFGRLRCNGNPDGTKTYIINEDGLAYWNEDQAALPQALTDDSIFKGYVKDPNVFAQDPATLAIYQLSMSTFPQILTDGFNNVFLLWSSVTMLKDATSPGTPYLLRHIFGRASTNGGATWHDSIMDINHDFFSYHLSECVYPSVAPLSDNDTLYINFQGDQFAGTEVFDGGNSLAGQSVTDSNYIYLIKTPKDYIIQIGIGINEKKYEPTMMVSQNSPNPFTNQTQVTVTLSKPGTLTMEVYSLVGQKVMEINKGTVNTGDYHFTFNSSQFSPGIYFYTVKCNNETSTHKMIVD